MPPTTISGKTIGGEVIEMPLETIYWRPSVYALVMNEQRELLIQDNAWTGKYYLPGGGIEMWENITEALIREVWEETGLNVAIQQILHVDDEFFVTPNGKHWHVVRHFFLAKPIGGTLRDSILEDEPTYNPHWLSLDVLREDQITIGWPAIEKIKTLF